MSLIPDTCSHCGQTPITRYLYGRITKSSKALQAQIDAGTVVLGGCVIREQSPQWRCPGCGHVETMAAVLEALAQALPRTPRQDPA